MSDDPPIGERLAAIERDVVHLLDEARAIRNTLHNLLTTAINDHGVAIRALSAAHEQKIGIWWTLAWASAAVVVIAGGITWLVEHNITISVTP